MSGLAARLGWRKETGRLGRQTIVVTLSSSIATRFLTCRKIAPMHVSKCLRK